MQLSSYLQLTSHLQLGLLVHAYGSIHDKNIVDVLHVWLTDLHAAYQNLPFPPNRTLPLQQYQYQGRLW